MYPGHWVKHKPDHPAAINSASGATLTYRELDEQSNRLAQLMFARGLRRGDHVSVFMDNDLTYFVVTWAALRSGLYLTTVNRYLTAEEAAYIVDNSESRVLIVASNLSDVAREIPPLTPRCDTYLAVNGEIPGYDAFDDAIGEYPSSRLEIEPSGGFMLYSSGTTGRPKGILRPLPEGNIDTEINPQNALLAMLWQVNEDSVYLSPAPLYHSAPIGFCTAIQAMGGTAVIMPRFDEIGALEAIEKYKVSHSQWVPTMFTRMLKLPANDRTQFDLSSHQVAIHAAAPCPTEIKKRMMDWWGPILYEYYGGTELNGLTHVTPQEWLEKPGTVGKPILGVIHVCDEGGHELAPGEPGIVYFELPEMPFEYLKDAEKTKDAQHPDHANWSALGDVGYVDEDGYLFLTDRATFMIISGGVNIYPQEIEDVMVVHDHVLDVAVIGVPNKEMGEEVKAVVQLVDGIEPSEEEAEALLAWTRDHIAHYKAPRSVDFRDELPRLPTGKLYKRLLKDEYWGKTGSRIV
ncbi:MAG: acyl-CoA synthetase [Gammaproteobacteria bacterium]|nr:acyl-CoA synthetase [Gammaproteobacteria bacterium]